MGSQGGFRKGRIYLNYIPMGPNPSSSNITKEILEMTGNIYYSCSKMISLQDVVRQSV